jgi:hypothetical protein
VINTRTMNSIRWLTLPILALSLLNIAVADCSDPQKSGITHSDSLGVPSVSLNYYATGARLCFKDEAKVYECTANGWKATYKECGASSPDAKTAPPADSDGAGSAKSLSPDQGESNELLQPIGSGYLENDSLSGASSDGSDAATQPRHRSITGGQNSSSPSSGDCTPPEAISAIEQCQAQSAGSSATSICQIARKGAACMRRVESACGSCGSCFAQTKSLIQQLQTTASQACSP